VANRLSKLKNRCRLVPLGMFELHFYPVETFRAATGGKEMVKEW
jgi:hypothetical protein